MEKTLEVLRQSLLALSNGPVNMPEAATQLSETRFAILKMEGVEIDKTEYAEYLAAAKMKAEIRAEINKLYSERQLVTKEIADLQVEFESDIALLQEFKDFKRHKAG